MFLFISSWIGWLLATGFVFGQTMSAWQIDSLQVLHDRSTGARRAQLAVQLSDALQTADWHRAQQFALEGLSLLNRFPNTTLRLCAVRSLAATYAMNGETYRADSCYKSGIHLAKSVGNDAELISLLMSLAATCTNDGRNLEALPLLREALDHADGPAHQAVRPLLVRQLGNICERQGEYGLALAYFYRALQEAESRQDRNGMGLAESNIAGIYTRLGNPQRAIAPLNRAVEHFVASSDAPSANRCRLQIAGNYLSMNRPDSAQPLTEQGMWEAKRQNYQFQLAMAHVLMGRLNLLGQKAALSERHAREALTLVPHTNEGTHAQALMCLAKAISVQGRSAEAIRVARAAVTATWQATNKNERREANGILADVLEAAGKPTEALTVRKSNEVLSDSLYTAGFQDQLSYLQVAYETEKKEQRNAFQNRENTLRERQLWGLVAGLLLMVGLLGIVITLFRLKQRDTRRIQRQKEEIERQSGQLTLLMRELHHRVKNNLQIISSLLSLQSRKLVDQQARTAVREGQSRVEAMSMLQQRLYTTDDVTTINFSSFVTDLINNLMVTYGYSSDDFDLTLELSQHQLDTDTAIPLGLILHELVTNAFKYAYDAVKRPALTVRLEAVGTLSESSAQASQLRLTVQDNGPGLPADQADTLLVNMNTGSAGATTVARPANRSRTFGMQLIHSLTRQIRATCQFRSGNGLLVQLDMPFHFS